MLSRQGVPNNSALRNPDCLGAMGDGRRQPRRRRRPEALDAAPAATSSRSCADLGGEVLGVPGGPDDDFFECGGTSGSHSAVVPADRRPSLGEAAPLSTILHAPTISSLAALLRDDLDHGWGTLELLRAGTSPRPLFVAPGLFGDPLLLRPLAERIDTDRAVYGLRGRGLMGDEHPLQTVEEMATEQIDGIRSLQPHGPYALLGYSLGGAVVVEIARRLLRDGEQVEFLGVVDTHFSWGCLDARGVAAQALRLPLRWPRAFTADLPRTLRHVQRRIGLAPVAAGDPQAARIQAAGRRAVDTYRPLAYPGSTSTSAPPSPAYCRSTRPQSGGPPRRRFGSRPSLAITTSSSACMRPTSARVVTRHLPSAR